MRFAIPQTTLMAILLATLTFAGGCRAVEGIFKAGMWVGIVVAVLVVAAVFGVVRMMSS